jgi:hypothetical protein
MLGAKKMDDICEYQGAVAREIDEATPQWYPPLQASSFKA